MPLAHFTRLWEDQGDSLVKDFKGNIILKKHAVLCENDMWCLKEDADWISMPYLSTGGYWKIREIDNTISVKWYKNGKLIKE